MNKYPKITLLALVYASLLAACSIQRSILGKWVETDGREQETDEYLKDGTFIVNSSTQGQMTGKYSFADETHMKLQFDGLMSVAGTFVLTVKLSGGELSITDPNGKVSTYKRSD